MSKPKLSLSQIKSFIDRMLLEFQPEYRKTFWKRLKRNAKLQYWKLLRSPGGGHKVSLGFAIGFGLEMILPITFYTAYVLMIPLAKNKNLLSASIVGNLFGKISLLPILFIPLGHRLGHWMFVPFLRHLTHHTVWHNLFGYFSTIVGLSICGIFLGSISYVIVYLLYLNNRNRRLAKRKCSV